MKNKADELSVKQLSSFSKKVVVKIFVYFKALR